MAASSSSMAAATMSAAVSHIGSSLGISSGSGALAGAGTSSSGGSSVSGINASAAQFREIHKNTWLKRLTAEGKKITVGPKKSERSWVVFCVHDDTEALLEGYAEPRQAACHNPEWIVSMQDTLHISHALIPNSHEFEFVVTLTNEVIRFHAMSWEIMQEWVETLRSKLREMKILSPRENLYTKLPEIRAPLLPTRDPTSPLPAPPPVPAALVPGVERVIPTSMLQENTASIIESAETATRTNTSSTFTCTSSANMSSVVNHTCRVNSNNLSPAGSTSALTSAITNNTASLAQATTTPALSAMSNTLTQNLLNMLSDPISAYSEQLSYVADIEEAPFANEDNTETERCFSISSSPLLRKSSKRITATSSTENSVRVDVNVGIRISADEIRNRETVALLEGLTHTRIQTSRSLSAGAADNTRKQLSKLLTEQDIHVTADGENISALEMSSYPKNPVQNNAVLDVSLLEKEIRTDADTTNITIIQVSNESKQPNEQRQNKKTPTKSVRGEIFQFPDTQNDYKSNVQIIPSNETNSSTIHLLGNQTALQYSTPVKKHHEEKTAENPVGTIPLTEQLKVTTVHVAGDAGPMAPIINESLTSTTNSISLYGTCFNSTQTNAPSAGGTPKMAKKIILSANTSGITNITVNNVNETTKLATATGSCDSEVKHNFGNIHYEKVFLSTSVPVVTTTTKPGVVTQIATASAPRCQIEVTPSVTLASQMISAGASCSTQSSIPTVSDNPKRQDNSITATTPATILVTTPTCSPTRKVTPSLPPKSRNKSAQPHASSSRAYPIIGSPAQERHRIASPTNLSSTTTATTQAPLPSRAHFLTRGLTEAVITRPSRRDVHFFKAATDKSKSSQSSALNPASSSKSAAIGSTNNNGEASLTSSGSNGPLPSRINNESLEQRRRSSSTSDARSSNRGTNNNEATSSRAGVIGGNTAALRFQQPPQPFRSMENGVTNGTSNHMSSPPPTATNSPAGKRMTLREHQVMQLRREIMHPGGVRLQLRRKDCVGSIAWVEAFGAIWVAGWKQKEHPVLYNALHIGDQLLSIAGVSINSASEANKFIRNSNTLFVEVLVRRIPFGRGYAIRREREGQCLGLIRDGNTATIVDVVPNSLAARFGLPPKAQSCDGTTLTFWVLTEINGRPLNLFFKDNEIKDRLNSVGRDISILVQPSDLITKLKKQLKSLRGYKDYLVQ